VVVLEKLPEYRPARSDAEITSEVRDALTADARTREEQNIDVHTRDGVVHLGGSVGTEDAKRAAAGVAGGVSGVWEVNNGLTVESAVANAVDEALVRDPRMARALIDVTYLGGSVTLRGQVRTLQEKAAAVEIARGVPGVVAAIDELEVHPDAERKRWPSPEEESVLAAAGLANAVKRS
jgi:osmotically-inducible protein OsmY